MPQRFKAENARMKVLEHCESRWDSGLNCSGCIYNRNNCCSQSDVIDGILLCSKTGRYNSFGMSCDYRILTYGRKIINEKNTKRK